jgi:uncharacterized protein YkwD
MRLRSLSVAVLAAVLAVPVTGTVASAAEPTGTAVGGVTTTYKTSAGQRAKRAARAVAPAPVVAAPSVTLGYADRVLALTNAERTSRGLRALALSGCADGFADSWSTKLASLGSLSHQALSPIMTTCRASRAGENVAYGNVTPEALVRMWMESAGHRANILNAAFTHIGVGTTTTSTGRVYGVQVFVTL